MGGNGRMSKRVEKEKLMNIPTPLPIYCMNLKSQVRFYDTFTAIFSESATEIFLRFRVQPCHLRQRGRVQWCEKLQLEFFFSAGNVFFGRNRKTPLFFHGPRAGKVLFASISRFDDTFTDIFSESARQNISRCCTMINNTPNLNCVQCWLNLVFMYLVTRKSFF